MFVVNSNSIREERMSVEMMEKPDLETKNKEPIFFDEFIDSLEPDSKRKWGEDFELDAVEIENKYHDFLLQKKKVDERQITPQLKYYYDKWENDSEFRERIISKVKVSGQNEEFSDDPTKRINTRLMQDYAKPQPHSLHKPQQTNCSTIVEER